MVVARRSSLREGDEVAAHRHRCIEGFLGTIPSGVGRNRRGHAERYAILSPGRKSSPLTAWSASTRKEEITRFSKAVNNPDFSRMLRARNLGPEHLEKQTRLRKQVRVRVWVVCQFTPSHVP